MKRKSEYVYMMLASLNTTTCSYVWLCTCMCVRVCRYMLVLECD